MTTRANRWRCRPPCSRNTWPRRALVADHLVLKPRGFDFAPHPAITDTDRDKYCVGRIIRFYQHHKVDYADYFLAAWRYHHRAALGKPEATLRDFAASAGLSARYLERVEPLLTRPEPSAGPLGELQTLWRKLPEEVNEEDAARRGCREMRELVIHQRKSFEPEIGKVGVQGISPGSQCFVLWENRQRAAQRMRYPGGDPNAEDLTEFCRVFPDAFFLSSRAPYFDPKSNRGKERPLTAGFHLMQGFFRDDAPLCELVLDDAERSELDGLWQELNFVASAPIRQYKDFIFFERAEPPRFAMVAEFDFARARKTRTPRRPPRSNSFASPISPRPARMARRRSFDRGDRDLFRHHRRRDPPGRGIAASPRSRLTSNHSSALPGVPIAGRSRPRRRPIWSLTIASCVATTA